MEMSDQLYDPAALSPGKSPRYPSDRSLGGTQNRAGRRGEEKIFPLPGLELRTLCRSALSQSLYPLRYPASSGFGPSSGKINGNKEHLPDVLKKMENEGTDKDQISISNIAQRHVAYYVNYM
jgi:hypothetical protein